MPGLNEWKQEAGSRWPPVSVSAEVPCHVLVRSCRCRWTARGGRSWRGGCVRRSPDPVSVDPSGRIGVSSLTRSTPPHSSDLLPWQGMCDIPYTELSKVQALSWMILAYSGFVGPVSALLGVWEVVTQHKKRLVLPGAGCTSAFTGLHSLWGFPYQHIRGTSSREERE